MNPEHLKYTKSHEWVSVENGVATIGITDHAQTELGDITFLELPDVGKEVAQGDEIAVVESVKAASDIMAPVGGKVAEVNTALEDEPETVNEDPYGKGWICKLENCAESDLENLMSADAYAQSIEG